MPTHRQPGRSDNACGQQTTPMHSRYDAVCLARQTRGARVARDEVVELSSLLVSLASPPSNRQAP
jgi:hypothetical protein